MTPKARGLHFCTPILPNQLANLIVYIYGELELTAGLNPAPLFARLPL